MQKCEGAAARRVGCVPFPDSVVAKWMSIFSFDNADGSKNHDYVDPPPNVELDMPVRELPRHAECCAKRFAQSAQGSRRCPMRINRHLTGQSNSS
jgi:hypothetical protein